MKNLSLVLNVVLLIAVGVLYVLHFSGGKSGEQEEEKGLLQSSAYSVAYVDSDSVVKNYDFFKKKQEELTAKSEKLQNEYKNRAEGLQREVNDYQRNVNNLTIGQAKALEEDLMKKQQNLRMYQESLSQQLMQDQNKVQAELYEKVSEFLKGYSSKKGLELVVQYTPGSDVLYANDSMNITGDVIKGLNEAYNSEVNSPEEDSTVVSE
ncbi:OmpH family outer membrane protein [Fulvivirga sediminis]|uniref:OmpH family outer membrane protein n=1 Tax=Fulvivirga sediminis TaxID=2803949 RepID=A0A937JXQ3_9BACT|nr:OmpH family outer membrane protein [Fulvivirga sediminis]MBL3655688.1 OmpH family outer membrane protein [Fulvivirga sediminis]